jgi:hypothetical protein
MHKTARRCWEGYEAVPGVEPYAKGSCRPVGETKDKKEKKAKAFKRGFLKAALAHGVDLRAAVNLLNW